MELRLQGGEGEREDRTALVELRKHEAIALSRQNYMQQGHESKHKQHGQLFVMVSSHLGDSTTDRGGTGGRGYASTSPLAWGNT